ncbi:hypothetical protein GCM10028784_18680 [Myceligenerans cantabricum]
MRTSGAVRILRPLGFRERGTTMTRPVPEPPAGETPAGERPSAGPARDGPPRRVPRWVPAALFLTVVAVFVAIFAWNALGKLQGLGVSLLVAFFLTQALEPFVLRLVRRRWRRGVAAGVVLTTAVTAAAVLLALFGNLFARQLVALLRAVPGLYTSLVDTATARFGVDLPASDELVHQAVGEYGDDVASGALLVGTTALGALFASFTVLLVAYYLLAAGPRFRAAVCRWLRPGRQQEVLRLWEISQRKISDFITSRIVLAALSSVFTTVFLMILGTPYAVPLGVFTGVVSQFVPTIGTYIGGALPVAVSLTSQGLPQALGVLAFVIGYQQLENLYFAPKVSARALEMNPAVSFVAVLAFGAVFGPLGAFLALPVAATIQAVASTYLERHELVESPLFQDPQAHPPRRPEERPERHREERPRRRSE